MRVMRQHLTDCKFVAMSKDIVKIIYPQGPICKKHRDKNMGTKFGVKLSFIAEKSNAAYSNDEVTSPQSITLDTQHGQAAYNNQHTAAAASPAAPGQGQERTQQGVPHQGYAQPPQPGYPQPYGQPQPYGYPQQAPYPQQQGVYYPQQQMVGATVVMQGQPVGVSGKL